MDHSSQGTTITLQQIEDFIQDTIQRENRTPKTGSAYRTRLKCFYDALGDDKRVEGNTLFQVRARMVEQGYAISTINGTIRTTNAFLESIGHPELKYTGNSLPPEWNPLPELTIWEYKRLLQSARAMDLDWVYLLIRVFTYTDFPIQCLGALTVEAVRAGVFTVETSKQGRQVVMLPRPLRDELLDHLDRHGPASGPVFVSRQGTAVDRSYLNRSLQRVCRAAGVPEEKGNPRCVQMFGRRLREERMAQEQAVVG